MTVFVKSLIRLCKKGKITLEDVPEKWREQVAEDLTMEK